MPIAALPTVLSASPAVALNGSSASGKAAFSTVLSGAPGKAFDPTSGTPNATANALVGQNTNTDSDVIASQGQLAGLLSGAPIKVTPLPIGIDADAKTDSTSGVTIDPNASQAAGQTNAQTAAAAAAQANSIAIPPINLYIDQQPNKNVVLTNSDSNSKIADATSGSSKKLVFASDNQPATAGKAVLANEVANQSQTQGALKLAGLQNSPTATAQDPAFAKAFSDIVQQGQDKLNAANKVTQTKVTDIAAASTDAKNLAADQANTTTALSQPTQVASKIAAKVLGIKEDKIDPDTGSDLSVMNAKLTNLDAQLRSKDYSSIQEVSSSLAQSPIDQVQLKISQATADGLNNIKINLHPAELGSVDVNMNVDTQGNTKIHIIADKADTLQMLRQDSTHLVKSLSEVGVKADAGSLQFSLRGDGQSQQNFAAMQQNNSNNGNQQQQAQQQASAVTGNYSRFSSLNEQDLILSINNKALNILV